MSETVKTDREVLEALVKALVGPDETRFMWVSALTSTVRDGLGDSDFKAVFLADDPSAAIECLTEVEAMARDAKPAIVAAAEHLGIEILV